MPQPVQSGRAAALLARANNIVGRLRLMLDETIVPVQIVELAPSGPIYTAPEAFNDIGVGWFSTIRASGSPGAGIFSAVSLTNPSDSGRLVVVDRISYAEPLGAGATLKLEVPATHVVAAASATGVPRDTRFKRTALGASAALVDILEDPVAIPGRLLDRVFGPIDVTHTFGEGVVLQPGDRATVHGPIANTNVNVTYVWREQDLPRLPA